MNLYLVKYNNYFNRVIKAPKPTFEEYELDDYRQIFNQNFNPNDGVSTTHIVNQQVEAYGWNYLIACNTTGVVESRWFILDSTRLKGGQYELELKRDSIADNYDKIINSKAYIYKGTVKYGNPLLFNNEGLQFNQIKISEKPIKDRDSTNGNTIECPFIVGYLNANNESYNESGYNIEVLSKNYDYYGFDNFPLFNLWGSTHLDRTVKFIDVNTAKIWFRNQEPFGGGRYLLETNPFKQTYKRSSTSSTNTQSSGISTYRGLTNDEWESLAFAFEGYMKPQGYRFATADFDYHEAYNNRIIFDYSNNKYYRVNVIKNENEQERATDIVYQNLLKSLWGGNITFNSSPYVEGTTYSISLIEIDTPIGSSQTMHIDGLEDAPALKDAPYKMFFMPLFDDIQTSYLGSSGTIDRTLVTDKILQLNIITALKTALGDIVYDLQILPYCPIRENVRFLNPSAFANYSSFSINDNQVHRVKIIGTDQQTYAILGFATESTFKFSIPNDYILNPNTAKQVNETDMWRLVSPNYNGSFEFNAVRNGGISSYNIDCTYKPYSPHIHVAPYFGGLYGSNFEDARGLICAGDFSIPQITSEWTAYQLNNKNFQLQFNRQVETMEKQYQFGMIDNVVNSIGSAVGGAVVGGKLAGVGGAVAGGVAGVLQGGYNVVESAILGADKIDAAKDQFNYNLQNILARPYNLTNIGCLNNDFKFFPFEEYYTCTDEEKDLLNNKLIYEGMTVGTIDKILNYIYENENNYIRARMIRFDDSVFELDYHMANDINNELLKGVYFHD